MGHAKSGGSLCWLSVAGTGSLDAGERWAQQFPVVQLQKSASWPHAHILF
jgi:hypothetical protein